MFQPADPRTSMSAAPDCRWKRWRLSRILGILAIFAWVCAVGAGIERIWRYESTPGLAGTSPQTWPGSRLVSPKAGQPTLVTVSYTHLRAHETPEHLVCRL